MFRLLMAVFAMSIFLQGCAGWRSLPVVIPTGNPVTDVLVSAVVQEAATGVAGMLGDAVFGAIKNKPFAARSSENDVLAADASTPEARQSYEHVPPEPEEYDPPRQAQSPSYAPYAYYQMPVTPLAMGQMYPMLPPGAQVYATPYGYVVAMPQQITPPAWHDVPKMKFCGDWD